MRLAIPTALALLAAALLAGCGAGEDSGTTSGEGGAATDAPASPGAPPGAEAVLCRPHTSDADELRATGVGCPRARELMFRWQGSERCAPPPGISRSGCTISSYRCQATVADRGISVSCSRPGRSVAFLAQH